MINNHIKPNYNITINLGNSIRETIVGNVIGQLSDGIWENSPAMEKYWRFATTPGTDLLVDSNSIQSGFYEQSEDWIRNWFAKKIKAIVKRNLGDDRQIWNRNNMTIVDYLSYPKDISVSACYECYDYLLGRTGHKYAFQLLDNKPEFIAYRKLITSVLTTSLANNQIDASEASDWIDSVIDFFKSHYDKLFASGFDAQYLSDMQNDPNSEKYEISWPHISEASAILDKSLRQNSNYFMDITSRLGYSITPDDCFKALYFIPGGIRDILYNNLEAEYKTH